MNRTHESSTTAIIVLGSGQVARFVLGTVAAVANVSARHTQMIPLNRNCYRFNGLMASTGNRGGGRRSKGDRRLVGARMPVPDAEKLAAVAEASGTTVSDYVAALVKAHLSTVDLDHILSQEALPIAKAS